GAKNQIVRLRFFKQGHVIVYPAACVANWSVVPFLIRKDGRDVLALHVHRATVYAVDRAVVDDSFEVKALHYWIAILSRGFAPMGRKHYFPFARMKDSTVFAWLTNTNGGQYPHLPMIWRTHSALVCQSLKIEYFPPKSLVQTR